jgi:DNA repair exonuclease SbcCD ATPase subunit
MDLNPLTGVCAEIQRQLTGLQQSEKQVAGELHWYTSLNPQALENDKRSNEAKAEQLQREIQALDQDIQGTSVRLGELAPVIGTLFNPLNWFAKDQIDLRRKRSELRAVSSQKTAERQARVTELEGTRTRISNVASELDRHRAFDLPRRQAEQSRLKQSIVDKASELAFVADRKRRVDEILAPLVQEMQDLEARKQRAQSDLDSAEDFDRQLSSAGNSYERAMIHEQCERSFGTGSPRKIIGERQREVRQLERDYDKARRRVEEVARTAARRIDTVVIDGNNLCYESNRFIGLAAVEALLPLISRMCAVVVVFDSAIRRLLNTDDSALQRRLAGHAKVHVVASRRMADETVLDLATGSEFTYVLSNDRFGDFNEKPAVKGGRVIRHEIVNGNVFVHDLQLRVAYH